MVRKKRSDSCMRYVLLLALASCLAGPSAAADPPPGIADDSGWCPPVGPDLKPHLPTHLAEGQYPSFKPGWALISMRVHPGAVPVTDVRVLSEAGGDALARAWLPLVRQWVGCATNQRETNYRVRFTFGIEGIPTFPSKEGFSLRAFRSPPGEPKLPAGDWGVGVCPIRATLLLKQPGEPNVVIEMESAAQPAVKAWLESLVPDLDYMRPSPEGNRVEFECRASDGRVTFYSR